MLALFPFLQGKTTAHVRLANFLRQRGAVVYTVPEVATLLLSNGASSANAKSLQQEILRLQLQLENSFARLASDHSTKPMVLLCDRGLMDGQAYCEPEVFEAMLADVNLTAMEARDGRYAAVMHLETAAKVCAMPPISSSYCPSFAKLVSTNISLPATEA